MRRRFRPCAAVAMARRFAGVISTGRPTGPSFFPGEPALWVLVDTLKEAGNPPPVGTTATLHADLACHPRVLVRAFPLFPEDLAERPELGLLDGRHPALGGVRPDRAQSHGLVGRLTMARVPGNAEEAGLAARNSAAWWHERRECRMGVAMRSRCVHPAPLVLP